MLDVFINAAAYLVQPDQDISDYSYARLKVSEGKSRQKNALYYIEPNKHFWKIFDKYCDHNDKSTIWNNIQQYRSTKKKKTTKQTTKQKKTPKDKQTTKHKTKKSTKKKKKRNQKDEQKDEEKIDVPPSFNLNVCALLCMLTYF